MDVTETIETPIKETKNFLPTRDQAILAIRRLYREANTELRLIKNRHFSDRNDSWILNQVELALAFVQSAKALEAIFNVNGEFEIPESKELNLTIEKLKPNDQPT